MFEPLAQIKKNHTLSWYSKENCFNRKYKFVTYNNALYQNCTKGSAHLNKMVARIVRESDYSLTAVLFML